MLHFRIAEMIKSGHPPTLFLAFLYFTVSFAVWVLMSVLGVYIASDFGLTAAQKGLLVAIPLLGGSLVRIPLGMIVDRVGPKRTGLFCQGFVMIPLMWAWLLGNSLFELMAIGLLLGIAGGSFAIVLPLASRWYPPQCQGLALGLVGVGNIGTVLAALLAPRFAERVGWHGVFGLALIPVVVTLICYAALAQEKPSTAASKPLGALLSLCWERDLLWFSLFYGFTFGGFVGLTSFLVIFFHDQYELSRIAAGNVAALCALAGSLSRPVGGYLADRFGGTQMLGLLFALVSLAVGIVSVLPPLWLTATLLAFVIALLGLGNGAMFQLVPLRFPQEIGLATGVVGAAGGLGGFLLPTGLGIVKERTGSYGVGFLGFCIAGIACWILLGLVQRRWRLSWLAETFDSARVKPKALILVEEA